MAKIMSKNKPTYEELEQRCLAAERKLAEESLRAGNSILQASIDGHPIPIFSLDSSYRYTSFNESHAAMMKAIYGVKIVLGRSLFEHEMIEVDRLKLKHNLDRALAGERFTAEAFSSAAVQNGRYYEVDYNPIYHDTGEVIGVALFAHDITRHKQTEAALHSNTEWLSLALGAAQAGIWEWDLQTNENTWSEELWQVYGLEPHSCQPSYETWLQTIHPADRARAAQAVQEAAENGTDLNTEWRILDRDGTERWLMSQGRPTRDASGHVVRYTGIVLDVTARKQAQADIRESEMRFSTIFHASPVGICLTRLTDGQIIDANIVFLEILGYSREEALKKRTQEMGMWAVPEERHKIVQLLNKQGRVLNIELKLRRKSGEIGETLVSAELIELAGERYILSMIQDITERKRAEVEKEKLQAHLVQAQKMESVGRLAGGVAHDFNNMLSVMMLHAEIGLSQLEPTSKLYDNLQEIHKATQRSADLTRQLLAFARKQLVAPKVLDLNETIEALLKMLRPLIGEGITLLWVPMADVRPVKIDPSQIDQILVNLCVNARDAISERGKIIIETGNVVFDDAYCITHAEAVPGKFVLLSVSDDGSGVDQETQRMLFEPFFTTKELGKGTGLGLATVYGIVKQNNGFITVYSEPGLGTTFKVYLPQHGDQIEQVEQSGTLAPLAQGHEVVLVVEDEAAILEVVTTTLRTQGYTVLQAATPDEALHLIQDYTGKLHLLVTDMIMPGMNGRELAKNLVSSYPQLKVLYMSGYTPSVIAHHGILDEQVCFIAKPFSIREISLKVREVLDLGKATGYETAQNRGQIIQASHKDSEQP